MNIQLIKSNDCDQHIAKELKNKLPTEYHQQLIIQLNSKDIHIKAPESTLDTLTLSVLDEKAEQLSQSINAQQPLLKALGKDILKRKSHIIDATAGFGHDSFIMCRYGLEVTSIEQDPVVYAVLDALKNMLLKKYPQLHWQVLHGDSIHWLEHISQHKQVDAIYLDPFFIKKAKALPKNRMQWLQQLAAQEAPSAETLFNHAMSTNIAKIIVKRDLKAAYICNQLPNAGSITQKTSRFDCYFRPKT